MDPLDNGEPLESLPCGHKFHEDCIEGWFDKKEICPVCNKKFKNLNNQQE